MRWEGRTFEQPDDGTPTEPLRCSFCGKLQSAVEQIVCGPTSDVAICNECVRLAAEIMSEVPELPDHEH